MMADRTGGARHPGGSAFALLAGGALLLCLLLAGAGPKTLGARLAEFPGLAQPRENQPGLPNFARVSQGLYRGAQPNREGFERLRAMGVRTVVNLRDHHSDAQMLEGLDFQYIELACDAWHLKADHVVRFLRVASDPGYQPVFVHCQHGSDRTGAMVAAYRMVVQAWPLAKAEAELPNFGFHPVFRNIKDFLAGLDPAALRMEMREMPDRQAKAPVTSADENKGGLD